MSSFTCPRCGIVSHNDEDAREGYCGACHDWTAVMPGQTEPQFKVGDRFFTHYDGAWGSVVAVNHTVRNAVHGVTGDRLPDTTWYDVLYDGDQLTRSAVLDDAHGNWDMARMLPPGVARRYGYGDDPNPRV